MPSFATFTCNTVINLFPPLFKYFLSGGSITVLGMNVNICQSIGDDISYSSLKVSHLRLKIAKECCIVDDLNR